jgi:hemolysin III
MWHPGRPARSFLATHRRSCPASMTDLSRGSAEARATPPLWPAAEPSAVTPRLRGRLHQLAFAAAIPAGVALVVQARTTPARLAAAVYATSLAGLYGTSAAFHRGRWSPAAGRRMDQADHAIIYVLIAGTYTPFALLAFDRTWGVAVLGVVWTVAAAGIVVVIRRHRIRLVGIMLYLTLGWMGVVALPWLAGGSGPSSSRCCWLAACCTRWARSCSAASAPTLARRCLATTRSGMASPSLRACATTSWSGCSSGPAEPGADSSITSASTAGGGPLPGSGVFRLPSGLALFLVSTTGISWRQPLPDTAGRGARRPSGTWYSSAAGGCRGGWCRLGTRAKELPSGKAASHAPASIRGPGRGSREWSFFAPPDGSSLHVGELRRRLPAHCNSAPDVRYRRSALRLLSQ